MLGQPIGTPGWRFCMVSSSQTTTRRQDARAAIDAVPGWYHSIDVHPGLVTPGYFDLRGIVGELPWPELAGKRCLDVGTADGFLAFELERRGAAEVVAVDLASHQEWDFERHLQQIGPRFLSHVAGPVKGHGFRVARELLGSQVSYVQCSTYELSPEKLGEFDVVVCGSLLLHLRDPLRALAAIRSVCRERFLCTNQVELGLSLAHPRLPLSRIDGTSGLTQWWLTNVAGHRQLLCAAGFEPERESRVYAVPFGPAHPPRGRTLRALTTRALRYMVTGGDGVPHHAILARVAAG